MTGLIRELLMNDWLIGTPVIICGILILLFTVIKTLKIIRSDQPQQTGLTSIWLTGLLSLLFSILSLVLSVMFCLEAISLAGDISPTMISEELAHASSYLLLGISLFILSLIIWGILNRFRSCRSEQLSTGNI